MDLDVAYPGSGRGRSAVMIRVTPLGPASLVRIEVKRDGQMWHVCGMFVAWVPGDYRVWADRNGASFGVLPWSYSYYYMTRERQRRRK